MAKGKNGKRRQVRVMAALLTKVLRVQANGYCWDDGKSGSGERELLLCVIGRALEDLAGWWVSDEESKVAREKQRDARSARAFLESRDIRDILFWLGLDVRWFRQQVARITNIVDGKDDNVAGTVNYRRIRGRRNSRRSVGFQNR